MASWIAASKWLFSFPLLELMKTTHQINKLKKQNGNFIPYSENRSANSTREKSTYIRIWKIQMTTHSGILTTEGWR